MSGEDTIGNYGDDEIGSLGENDISLRPFHTLGFKKLRDGTIQHMERKERYTATDLSYKLGPKKYLVYLVGHHIAFYDYEEKRHAIYSKKKGVKRLIAFCLCKNKSVVALSEEWNVKKPNSTGKNDSDNDDNNFQKKSRFCVSYYSLGKTYENHLPLGNDQITPVVVLDFSRDRKYLAGITSPPMSYLYLWKLGKNVELTKTRLQKFDPIQILFNPVQVEQIQISALSSNECKLFRYQENELCHFDPLSNSKDSYIYTKHSWYDDEKILICTTIGDVIIMDKFEVVKILKNIFQNKNCGVFSICAIERGFLCGGDKGLFALYERSYDSSRFVLYKLFQTQEKTRIIDLCLSRKEENVLLASENNQFYRFLLSNIDILKSTDNHFISLPINFHNDYVISADTCLQKSILLTCSSDKTIRLWNFKRKKVELEHKFDDDIYDIALHPDGLKFLITFRFKVMMYAVLNTDLFKCCEWGVRNCRKVCFSNGGHLFALSVGTRIMIFSSITYEIIDNLSGHTGLVKDMVWGANDQLLASAGYEGAIFIWQVLPVFDASKPRLDENLNKLCSFNQIVFDSERRETVGIGNSTKIWGYNEAEGKVIDVNAQLSSICLSLKNKTMFIGTKDGRILMYKWPFEKSHYKECQIHSGNITKLLLDYDERFLFSIDEEQTLYMCKIMNTSRVTLNFEEEEGEDATAAADGKKNGKTEKKIVDDSNTNTNSSKKQKKENQLLLESKQSGTTKKWDNLEDITLILKSDLYEHENIISSLEEQVHQKMIDAERKINNERENRSKLIENMQKQHEDELENLKNQILKEQHKTSEKETAAERKIKKLEYEHKKEIKNQKLRMKELDKRQNLEFENREDFKNKEIYKLLKEKENLKEFYKSKINKTKQKFLVDKKQQIKSFNRLGQEYGMMTLRLKTEKNQSDEDYNLQIEQQRKEFERKIRKMKEEIDRLKKEHTSHYTKLNNLKETVSKKDKKIEEIENLFREKENDCNILDKKKKNLELEKKEKNKIISISNRKIDSQKVKIQDLEKLRLVLAHKYNSLQEEMEPKQHQIEKLEKQAKGMEKELQDMKNDQSRLKRQLLDQLNMEKILKLQINQINQKFVNKKRQILLILKELNFLLIRGNSNLINSKNKIEHNIINNHLKNNKAFNKHEDEQQEEQGGGENVNYELELKKILEKYSSKKKSISIKP